MKKDIKSKIVYAPTQEKFEQGVQEGIIDGGDLVVMKDRLVYITSEGEQIDVTPTQTINVVEENITELTKVVEDTKIKWIDYTKEEETE